MAVVGIAVAGIVVVLHRQPVEDTQEQGEAVCPARTLVQQEIVVPYPLDDPVHIASHSSYAALVVPAVAVVAAAVVVLRFPLYLLYE